MVMNEEQRDNDDDDGGNLFPSARELLPNLRSQATRMKGIVSLTGAVCDNPPTKRLGATRNTVEVLSRRTQ